MFLSSKVKLLLVILVIKRFLLLFWVDLHSAGENDPQHHLCNLLCADIPRHIKVSRFYTRGHDPGSSLFVNDWLFFTQQRVSVNSFGAALSSGWLGGWCTAGVTISIHGDVRAVFIKRQPGRWMEYRLNIRGNEDSFMSKDKPTLTTLHPVEQGGAQNLNTAIIFSCWWSSKWKIIQVYLMLLRCDCAAANLFCWQWKLKTPHCG